MVGPEVRTRRSHRRRLVRTWVATLVVAGVGASGCHTVIAGEAVRSASTASASISIGASQQSSPAASSSTAQSSTAPSSTAPSSTAGTASSPDAAPGPGPAVVATTANLDRPRPTAAHPTSASRPASPTPPPVDVPHEHDLAFAALLSSLTAAVAAGGRTQFLQPFAATLTSRVGHWFDNTETIGVAAARFVAEDDYSSAATDTATSFTRTVVLGVRTPYDDDNSMPGIAYAATVAVAGPPGKPSLRIVAWQPKYLGDPLNCNCTLRVAHSVATAVVADAADRDLTLWLPAALGAADAGIAWTHVQAQGSGLAVPKGQVIFLADRPFTWFLAAAGPAQSSNVTAGLVDALGQYPGTRYSDQSRIVLMLQASDGSTVPDDAQGREYASDVITHESTHQLMNRNSPIGERSANTPPTWVAEGIAVAVETLHRDSLGRAGDVGYPDPNDPKNIAPSWFLTHLTDRMPTQSQLYSGSSTDGFGYYAISGSVFRYIEREYGYVTMMKVAKQMYSAPDQSPFDYFPDVIHPAGYLPAATAMASWRAWFIASYG